MLIALYILVGWFGLGALCGLTLLGTSIVFRRSELPPPPLHFANAQHRQHPADLLSEPVRPAIPEPTATGSGNSDDLALMLKKLA